MDVAQPDAAWYALLARAQAAGWSLGQASVAPGTTWWTMAPLTDQRPATVQRLHSLEDVVRFLERAEQAPQLPDDLIAFGMTLYPNGIYIDTHVPGSCGVSCCFPTLERNIEAAREFVQHYQATQQREAQRKAAESAKPVKRPRRPKPAPFVPVAPSPVAPPAQLTFLEAA